MRIPVLIRRAMLTVAGAVSSRPPASPACSPSRSLCSLITSRRGGLRSTRMSPSIRQPGVPSSPRWRAGSVARGLTTAPRTGFSLPTPNGVGGFSSSGATAPAASTSTPSAAASSSARRTSRRTGCCGRPAARRQCRTAARRCRRRARSPIMLPMRSATTSSPSASDRSPTGACRSGSGKGWPTTSASAAGRCRRPSRGMEARRPRPRPAALRNLCAYRLLVAWFLDREGWTIDRLLASGMAQAEAEGRLLAAR